MTVGPTNDKIASEQTSANTPSHESSQPNDVSGVRSQFEQLIDRHGVAVLRTLVSLVGPIEADDVWQETFMAALRSFDRIPLAEHEERAWLWTIAHRKAIDHWRRNGATQQSELPDEYSDTTPRALMTEDPSESVVDAMFANENIWQRVARLPTKQRLCLTYRYIADLAFAEIALLVDCSEDAARRSAHEGITKIRKEMAS
jgi:RNA polymerase sigma factor (sigma-70 family)